MFIAVYAYCCDCATTCFTSYITLLSIADIIFVVTLFMFLNIYFASIALILMCVSTQTFVRLHSYIDNRYGLMHRTISFYALISYLLHCYILRFPVTTSFIKERFRRFSASICLPILSIALSISEHLVSR